MTRDYSSIRTPLLHVDVDPAVARRAAHATALAVPDVEERREALQMLGLIPAPRRRPVEPTAVTLPRARTPQEMAERHALVSRGIPHDARGRQLNEATRGPGSNSGPGRAKCHCGALSPLLPTSHARRAWGESHRAEATETPDSAR